MDIFYITIFAILIQLVYVTAGSNVSVIVAELGKNVSFEFRVTEKNAKVQHRRLDDENENGVFCDFFMGNSKSCKIEKNPDGNSFKINFDNLTPEDAGIYTLKYPNNDCPIETKILTLYDIVELKTIISEGNIKLGSIRWIPNFQQSVRMLAKFKGQEICNTIRLENKTEKDSTADATGRYYTINCSPIEEISESITNGSTITIVIQVGNETVLIDVWNITNSKQTVEPTDHDMKESNHQIKVVLSIVGSLIAIVIVIVIICVIPKVKKRNWPENGPSEDDGQDDRKEQVFLYTAAGQGDRTEQTHLDADDGQGIGPGQQTLSNAAQESESMMNGKREDLASCPNGIDTSLEDAKYQSPDHECESDYGVQPEQEVVNEIRTPCKTRGFYIDHYVQNQLESSDERQGTNYPSTTHKSSYGQGLQLELDFNFNIYIESDELISIGDSMRFSDTDNVLVIYMEDYDEDKLRSIHVSKKCVPFHELNEETLMLFETDADEADSFTSPDTLVKNPCFEVEQQNRLLCPESHTKTDKLNSDVGISDDVINMSDKERWLRKVKEIPGSEGGYTEAEEVTPFYDKRDDSASALQQYLKPISHHRCPMPYSCAIMRSATTVSDCLHIMNKEMEITNMHEEEAKFKLITTKYEEGTKPDIRTFTKGVRGNSKPLDAIEKFPQVTFKTGEKIMCLKKANVLSQWF